MPYKRIAPARDVDDKHEEFVDALMQELKLGETGTGPVIVEQPVRNSDRLHVYVLWDRWEGVREEHRTAAILDAYGRHFGEDGMRRVSVAMGITPKEGKEMGIDPWAQKPDKE